MKSPSRYATVQKHLVLDAPIPKIASVTDRKREVVDVGFAANKLKMHMLWYLVS